MHSVSGRWALCRSGVIFVELIDAADEAEPVLVYPRRALAPAAECFIAIAKRVTNEWEVNGALPITDDLTL
ncbi:hypothetical protein ACFQ4Q_01680 [Lysobacter gummosus]|uniref:hypothetical protein n=1 Tax=Lysobacter gummosus TaxID=262324 RepID=UPI00363CD384